jgi:hypothetical protein
MVDDTNALLPDSDEDGLTDAQELLYVRSNPTVKQTYGITREHEQMISSAFGPETWQAPDALRFDHIEECDPAAIFAGCELSDGSDDFDFVTTDGSGVRQFTYKALDGTERTDTWMTTEEELEAFELSGKADGKIGTHGNDGDVWAVWGSDVDNDGLTDGQEEYHLTKRAGLGPIRNRITIDRSLGTDPQEQDTDGDGYWDGWIGVYDVGYTDNVVLYRDRLSENGEVRDQEAVPQQTGIHDVPNQPAGIGADVDSDGVREHSIIYIGELTWGTNPQNESDVPQAEFDAEVGFEDSIIDINEIDSQDWEQGIEQNMGYYDLEVDLHRGNNVIQRPQQTFTKSEFKSTIPDNINRDDWMFVVHSYIVNSEPSAGQNLKPPNNGIITATEGSWFQADNMQNQQWVQNAVQNSQYNTEYAYVNSKIVIHELAHAYNIGEADDRLYYEEGSINLEVYSGTSRDITYEYVFANNRRWSLMNFGQADSDMVDGNLDGTYYAFSIEELLTVTEPE